MFELRAVTLNFAESALIAFLGGAVARIAEWHVIIARVPIGRLTSWHINSTLEGNINEKCTSTIRVPQG